MNASPRRLFMGLTLALFFTLAFAALADTDQAQQSPPLHEVSSTPAKTPPPPSAPAAPAAIPAPVAPSAAAATTSSSTGGVITTTSKDDSQDSDDDSSPPPHRVVIHHGGGHVDDRVVVMNDNEITADEHVNGDAVCVMGNLTVNGEVEGDAVCVMGDNTINSHVHGEVVCVAGTLHLGPKAEVDGEITVVAGDVDKDKGAITHHAINNPIGAGHAHIGSNFSTWFRHGPVLGRVLIFGPGSDVLWVISIASILVMTLLVFAFPKAIDTCGNLIAHRIGTVLLTGLLSVIAMPFLFILLVATAIGIPIALCVLPAAIILAKLFGAAALFVMIGRALLGQNVSAAVACLVVGLVYVILLAVPMVGLLLYCAVGFVGFGAGIAAILGTLNRSKGPKPPVKPAASFVPTPGASAFTAPAPGAAAPYDAASAASVAGGAPVIDVASVETPGSTPVPPPVFTPVPPPIAPQGAYPAASLPRAGFWVRMVALAIDMMLVGIVLHMLWSLVQGHSGHHDDNHDNDAYFFFLATYAVCFWKSKGTTVGGLIFHLRVVRLDDRPIDWATAIVRGLGCFLSGAVAFLGFIWIAFDDEKQAWHDKIAGTVVVQAPKGTPLV